MKKKSLAKVNLFFRVLKKRSDGYHEISTLMCKVPHLADEIQVELSERDFLSCTNPKIPTDSTNLAAKALNLFRNELDLNFSATIHIEKKIPVEAGLGGGSSNAAAVLSILNELHNHPLSLSDLMQIGAKIGSDVPFFFCKDAALVTGMGERVEEIKLPELGEIKIFKPEYGLSTKEIYAHSTPKKFPDPDQLLQSFLDATPIFHNDLEEAAYSLRPELKIFRNNLIKRYPSLTMTGSGSAHFVLCSRSTTADSL